MTSSELALSEAAAAVEGTGWSVILGSVLAAVPVTSLQQAVQVAGAAAAACGDDADHLRVDLRAHRVELSLQSDGAGPRIRERTGITDRDGELAAAVTAAVRELGLRLVPSTGVGRPVQRLEICVDAVDIAAVRPFWLAVLGMVPERGHDGPTDAITDPAWQLPAVWFQQMDEPRTERNRIHFDIAVPAEEAQARIAATVAAGGRVVSDDEAPAFWIMADPEGNEVCICTWQGRG